MLLPVPYLRGLLVLLVTLRLWQKTSCTAISVASPGGEFSRLRRMLSRCVRRGPYTRVADCFFFFFSMLGGSFVFEHVCASTGESLHYHFCSCTFKHSPSNFRIRCVAMFEGDTAMRSGNHEEAINPYSVALSFDPCSRSLSQAKQDTITNGIVGGCFKGSEQGISLAHRVVLRA